MIYRLLRVLGVLGILGLLTSCGTTSSTSTTVPTDDATEAARSAFDPNAPTLVIALDASESMLESDPGRFSVEGARLAGALLDTGANVGVLSFNRRSKTWFDLSSLRGPGDRERLERAVRGIPFRGQTDFRNALAGAYEALSQAGAPRGSAVLFLTDGRPDLGSDEASAKNLNQALAALEPYKKSGYRIFTIGLGPEVNAELLNRMSAETGAPPTWLVGADTKNAREEAKKLLSAFLQVTGDVNRYMEFDKGLAPVEVFPGTRKLVYVLVRDDPQTGFGKVSLDGKAVADSSYYRYPRVAASDSRFEVVFVEKPREGVWHAEVRGDPDIGAILEDIALEVALVEPPRKNLYLGQPIPLAVDVRFEHPGWKKILAERARATVDLVSAESQKVLAKDIPLLGGQPGSRRVMFKGAPPARMSRPGGPERVFARVKFTLARRTRGESSRTLTTSVTVRPHPDAKLTVAPDVLDLGARWVDDEVAARTLRVSNPTPAPLRIEITTGRRTDVSPATFELLGGDAREVEVTPGGAATAGAMEDTITIRAVPAGPGAKPSTVKVPVRGMFYELRSSKEIDLGSAAVDPKGPREAVLDVPLEIRPSAPGLIVLEAARLNGPRPLATKVESAGTRHRLLVSLPANAERGVYRASLVARPRIPGLRERPVPVRVEVWTSPEVTVKAPETVTVTSLGAREIDLPIRLDLRYPTTGAAVVARKGALVLDGDGPALTPDDYELVPESGWDGKALGTGRARVLTARIYVSSDVRNGTYRGQLKLTIRASGRPDGEAVVPLVLRVAR